ncbi:MAG: hypothetical protein AAFN07_01410 [Pseudomonadota bacterium]
MSNSTISSDQELSHVGLPDDARVQAAGSAKRGCAVQFAARRTGEGLLVGFHAFGPVEIVMICERLCRQWEADQAVSAPPMPTLLASAGLGREWAGDLLIVVEAASGLAEQLAAHSSN